MPADNDLISIIIPSYNYELFLREAIDSVINQDHKNWELIIVDDGSKDNSFRVAKEYEQKNLGKIFVKTHKDGGNKGLPDTLKLGISSARGEFVAFLEADDIFETNSISEKLELAQKNGSLFVFSDVSVFGDNKIWRMELENFLDNGVRRIKTDKKVSALGTLYKNLVPTLSSALVAREMLSGLDFNVPKEYRHWTDRWLFSQLSLRADFAYLNKKLTRWRVHDNNLNFICCKKIIDKNRYEKEFIALLKNILMRQLKKNGDKKIEDVIKSKYRYNFSSDSLYALKPHRMLFDRIEDKRYSNKKIDKLLVSFKDRLWGMFDSLP